MKQRIKIGKQETNIGAMDFSSLLDAPAGKHGFVCVKEGHFYFEDGIRAKFIGFNFPVRSNLPDHKSAEVLSARLASMGVNVVRIHAVDTMATEKGWSMNPGYPLIDYSRGSSREFDKDGWDRLDYWIHCLKEKGIYLHIDLLVGRAFVEGDALDYPGNLYSVKSCSHINERLIELQKEYATAYLTHINTYTQLALIDDPAVMGIQVANEDSVFFWAGNNFREDTGISCYRKEMQKRFNHYLLAKYNSRANLAEAWTFEGKCALGEDEDPEKGTVRCIEIGEYCQPVNEPMGEWTASEGPARYADFVEFGIMLNQKYYGQMLEHIRGLGAKIPLTTSCLLAGAADIYSHADGDFMENNAYFNHPAPRHNDGKILVPNLREYVATDPRTATYPGFEPRSNLVTQASAAKLAGKPFVLSEWNEYGEYPFHSSAFLMTTAYACLHDWDGLIIYCYSSMDGIYSQPEDEVDHIMDVYNDPSLILQFGTMAEVFLKGLVRRAEHTVDVVFSRRDLLTQPGKYRMPYSILPFFTEVRNVYLDQGENYQCSADAAVSGGFLSGGDYRNARHAVIYAHSPYRDAYRANFAGRSHLQRYVEKEDMQAKGYSLGERFLVFQDIDIFTKDSDYRSFAGVLDKAFKKWGILGEGQGISKTDSIISDTGELEFCPQKAFFRFDCGRCAFFTGRPEERVCLGQRYEVYSKNDRITLAMLSLDGKDLEKSRHILFTALGKSGMDGSSYTLVDKESTLLIMDGKLYMDTLEGNLKIRDCAFAEIWSLDVYGRRLECLQGVPGEGGMLCVPLNGKYFGNFELLL